ncbi:MAG TPA: BatA domain-containing protein [Longimicrobium sp.]|jgi:hypothetical protein
MLTIGAPLFLLAGALAALVPLALHLIRRRPPTRSPLPTARFLTEDARSSIRVSRPTDRLLMALRMLLLLLAGAAFARPSWVPAPRGTREVVLLDRSAAMRQADTWRRAVEQARRTLLAPDGSARGDLVLFDTSAVHLPQRRLTAATFDSLAAAGPSAHPASYAAALRAIDPAARTVRGADSVRVTVLSALRWGGWRPGMAALRQAAWPGAIRLPLVALPSPPDTAAPSEPEPRRSAVVIASGGAGRFVIPALEATGWTTRAVDRPSSLPADARLIVVTRPAGDLRAVAEAGATVVVDAGGAGSPMPGWLPVQGTAARLQSDAGDVWFGPDLRLPGATTRADIRPKRGATVLAAWDDGRPAVVAARLGKGCIVFAGTRLEDGGLPLSPAFPRALERMARACNLERTGDAMLPLDAGARAILGGRGAAVVNAAAGGGAGSVSLGRWLMAAALLIALAETFFAYSRRGAA